MYNILASGSKGNSVIYHNSIMVDCGVPFELIRPFLLNLQIILLSHAHGDHFNKSTISRVCFERPSLRVGCCEWMLDKLNGISNQVDVFQIGKVYDYKAFQISPVKLYHDVPNCGYRIFKDGTKIFHATDTQHLQGISAKGYDLYALEHNYNEETIYQVIAQLKSEGKFAHQEGSINSHLSEQQAKNFFFKNKSEGSQIIRLHESSIF